MSDNPWIKDGVFNLADFRATPLQIRDFLKRYVVRQDNAVSVLSTAVRNHYNRLRYEDGLRRDKYERIPKSSILLVGPTGSGKSHMASLTAKYIGVPCTYGDATKYTEEGYVGKSVDQLVIDLWEQTASVEQAELGMVYLDEVDKIARDNNIVGRDVSGGAVQESLLKLIEGTKVDCQPPNNRAKAMPDHIDSTNVLFILCGAFEGLLDQMVKRRKKGIGFGKDVRSDEDIRKGIRAGIIRPTVEDFKEYGMDDQFIGRIPYVAFLDELEEQDLYEIMNLPTCDAMKGKKREFNADRMELVFTEDGLKALASYAHGMGIGARAIKRAMDEVLLPFQTYLPSTEYAKESRVFMVTEDVVNDGERVLEDMLRRYPVIEPGTDIIPMPDTFPFEESVELSFAYTEPEYRDWISHLVPSGLLESAIIYGFERCVEPDDMPKVLDNLYMAIDDYEEGFRDKYGPELFFTDDAKELLMRLALESPHKRIEDIIYVRFGQHFEQHEMYRNMPIPYIEVDNSVLTDPKGSLDKLRDNK